MVLPIAYLVHMIVTLVTLNVNILLPIARELARYHTHHVMIINRTNPWAQIVRVPPAPDFNQSYGFPRPVHLQYSPLSLHQESSSTRIPYKILPTRTFNSLDNVTSTGPVPSRTQHTPALEVSIFKVIERFALRSIQKSCLGPESIVPALDVARLAVGLLLCLTQLWKLRSTLTQVLKLVRYGCFYLRSALATAISLVRRVTPGGAAPALPTNRRQRRREERRART